jgi:hypothetical protein
MGTRAIDVYVPVCVTLLVDSETGKVVSDGATGAYVDYDGMPWSNNIGGAVYDCLTETWGEHPINEAGEYLEDSDAESAAINLVVSALEEMDYPDHDRAEQWFDRNIRVPSNQSRATIERTYKLRNVSTYDLFEVTVEADSYDEGLEMAREEAVRAFQSTDTDDWLDVGE